MRFLQLAATMILGLSDRHFACGLIACGFIASTPAEQVVISKIARARESSDAPPTSCDAMSSCRWKTCSKLSCRTDAASPRRSSRVGTFRAEYFGPRLFAETFIERNIFWQGSFGPRHHGSRHHGSRHRGSRHGGSRHIGPNPLARSRSIPIERSVDCQTAVAKRGEFATAPFNAKLPLSH